MPQLRLATYNISGGITEDRRFYSKGGRPQLGPRLATARRSMAAIAETLRGAQVSIVALQEVDVCYNGGETLHQGQALAEAVGARCAYRPLFDYHLGRHTNVTTGLATLSQVPLVDQSAVRLRQGAVSWKRKLKAKLLGAKGALHTVHELEGQTLHVVNAHLTHDVDAQKEDELRFLIEYCAKLSPAVLLGDLNTTPMQTRAAGMVEPKHFATDGCMTVLREAARRHQGSIHMDPRIVDAGAAIDDICTYPSSKPSIKLDYCIGFSRNPSFSLDTEEVLAAEHSNHCASTAWVRWD